MLFTHRCFIPYWIDPDIKNEHLEIFFSINFIFFPNIGFLLLFTWSDLDTNFNTKSRCKSITQFFFHPLGLWFSFLPNLLHHMVITWLSFITAPNATSSAHKNFVLSFNLSDIWLEAEAAGLHWGEFVSLILCLSGRSPALVSALSYVSFSPLDFFFLPLPLWEPVFLGSFVILLIFRTLICCGGRSGQPSVCVINQFFFLVKLLEETETDRCLWHHFFPPSGLRVQPVIALCHFHLLFFAFIIYLPTHSPPPDHFLYPPKGVEAPLKPRLEWNSSAENPLWFFTYLWNLQYSVPSIQLLVSKFSQLLLKLNRDDISVSMSDWFRLLEEIAQTQQNYYLTWEISWTGTAWRTAALE